MNIFSKLTLAASLMALFAACSSSTSPTTGGNTVVPQKGSSFSYREVARDSTGAVTDSSNRFDTVLATGLTYQGKTNVSEIQGTYTDLKFGGTSMDTSYLNYETNGDISAFQKASAGFSGTLPRPSTPNTWLTLGLGSGSTTNLTIFDTSFTNSGTTFELTEGIKVNPSGASSLTVGSQVLNGRNIIFDDNTQLMTVLPMVGTKVAVGSSDDTITLLLVPSLGYFASINSSSVTTAIPVFGFPAAKSTSTTTMTGYSLK